jgi:predicted nucleic acid-binding protein
MRREPVRVYVDTSVYGGVFDPGFSEDSQAFFAAVRSGRFQLVASPIVEQELAGAPAAVRQSADGLLGLADVAAVTEDALQLQQAYLAAGIVDAAAGAADALHVALATVAECAMIVSWNFRHIVNWNRIRQYNAVNALLGYGTIAIHSPPEVVEDEGT